MRTFEQIEARTIAAIVAERDEAVAALEGMRARHAAACQWVDELRPALDKLRQERDAMGEALEKSRADVLDLRWRRNVLARRIVESCAMKPRPSRMNPPNIGPGATVEAHLERLERIIKGHRNIP